MIQNITRHIPFTKSQAVAYVTLPGFIPRLKSIGFRFTFVAQMMAILYGLVGLLPVGHPYLAPQNAGTFSIRQVFIEAARRLKFRYTHLDQVIMFFVLLGAFFLLAVQFFAVFLYLSVHIAHASGIGFISMFDTPDPTNDIAMMLLDHIFGVPNFFYSCISRLDTLCEPTSSYLTPYEPTVFPGQHQIALQTLFAYYSFGMGLIGMMIICYFLIAVLLESVQTGVPFGKRFASVYAPIRLCLAVLMLIPLPMVGNGMSYSGYNAAQYLTLYMTKLGSGLGTNVWNVFNEYFRVGGVGTPWGHEGQYGPLNAAPPTVSASPAATLIATPRPAQVDQLLKFMFLAHSCRAMYTIYPPGTSVGQEVKAFIITDIGFQPLVGTNYEMAVAGSKTRNLVIRFGIENSDKGEIGKECGEVRFRTTGIQGDGPVWLLEQYYNMIGQMWQDNAIIAFGDRIAYMYMPVGNLDAICGVVVPYPDTWGTMPDTCGAGQAAPVLPNYDYYNIIRDPYQTMMDQYLLTARDKQIASTTVLIDDKILTRGWAGAGIWYNKIATLNGGLFDAVRSMPELSSMPESMESVLKQRKATTEILTNENRYTPTNTAEGSMDGTILKIAVGLNQVYTYFLSDVFVRTDLSSPTQNPIFDLMNKFFGTEALFDMRKNLDVNPLVQLTSMGKAIVDQAFFNILVGGGMEFASGALGQLNSWKKLSDSVDHIGKAWFTVATLGLGIGILLYYVVPFLPFIYFFFSVIKWAQSIFEAMIGMPLWALAHLKIDGDGIPTEASEQGYYLLLEILLRPALTIFGMVASFIIFCASVYAMNDIFDLLAVNLTGAHPPSSGSMMTDTEVRRGTIDSFFYTVMYAVLVYMMALASFKLIDRIPKEILRWIGSEAKNIIDEMGDPAPDLIQKFYMQSFGMPVVQESGPLGNAIGSIRGLAKGVGGIVGKGYQDSISQKKPPGNEE